MPEEKYNILNEQEKEAKRYGIKLDTEDEDQEEKKDDSEEEESKEDKKPLKKNEEEEAESEEEKEDEDDSEDEEDQEEKLEPKRPSKGSLQQEAFKQREEKRLSGIVDQRLQTALSPITEMLKELKEAKTPAEKKETVENIDEELAKIAEAENLPVEQFKKIAGLIKTQVEAGLASKLKQVEEIGPMLEQERQRDQQRQTQEVLAKEWEKDAEPKLTAEYPNATAKQMKDARNLISELAVSADYGDTRGNKDGLPEHPAYPVDYIIYKEAEKFDTILRNPKKKSFESSGSLSDDTQEPQTLSEIMSDDKEITSAKEAMALSKKMDKAIGQEKTVIKRHGQTMEA